MTIDLILGEIVNFIFSEQIYIALLGVSAIFMSQSKNPKLHRYASIFGLVGQPFWFYMAYKNQAWGVFFLCLLYTWAWGKGFKKFWIDKQPK